MNETTQSGGADEAGIAEAAAERVLPSDDGEVAQRRMGGRLKESREYLGLSQQLVSERTGIPRSAISDIERGVRKVDSFELRKLAFIYRKPLEYFLDEAPDADPATHTLRYLTRAAAGMTEEDQRKLADYARLLETAANAERRLRR